MEDEVTVILLECSYSLLELSIRARKNGLVRVARCVFFLIFAGYDMVDARHRLLSAKWILICLPLLSKEIMVVIVM